MDNQQPRSRVGAWLKLILSFAVILLAVWVVLNRQYVVDRLTVWHYEPTSGIVSLADRSGMNEQGKFYFYASQPILSDRDDFVTQCSANNEQTAILGCYSAKRIYLFDINDARLDGIEEVTAAHEMLHAAYDRMSESQRHEVDQAVQIGYRAVRDERLDTLLGLYEDAEPGQRNNELFAILGTEYKLLPEELEDIYQTYFTDRSIVVGLAEAYQSTFEELSSKQTGIVDELNTLSAEISRDSESYNKQVEELGRDVARFNQRAEEGDFASQAEFDRQRSSLVSRQAQLVVFRESIDSRIARYDELSSQLEEINLLANELNQSLNPNLAEAPQL